MTVDESVMIEKPKVKFTLERFYPEFTLKYGEPLLKRHINRYKWAASKMNVNDIVLDAGCGCGWFDYHLLSACRRVYGIDISEEAIQYAKWKSQKVGENRLNYSVMDLSKQMPFGLYNKVICIEMIEHMDLKGQIFFMDKMKEILLLNGQLLITTPEKKTATGHFHKNEFDKRGFESFLKLYFNKVEFDDPAQFGIPDHFMLATCSDCKS